MIHPIPRHLPLSLGGHLDRLDTTTEQARDALDDAALGLAENRLTIEHYRAHANQAFGLLAERIAAARRDLPTARVGDLQVLARRAGTLTALLEVFTAAALRPGLSPAHMSTALEEMGVFASRLHVDMERALAGLPAVDRDVLVDEDVGEVFGTLDDDPDAFDDDDGE